jgi:CBS domain-containing protein
LYLSLKDRTSSTLIKTHQLLIVEKVAYGLTYLKGTSGGRAYDPRVHDRRTSMKAREIMSLEVVSVSPDASILEAVRLMLQNRISGLPVIDRGMLAGMVTEGDFLRRAETTTQRKRARWIEFFMGPGQSADDYVRTHGRKVADVMTPTPITVTEDTRLDDIVRLMERSRIKRLPVVRQGRVVGIVSRANLLHALASIVGELPASATTDVTIREQITSEFINKAWSPRDFNVVVRDGVVELWGEILDERERQAAKVAIENVAGVKAIKDYLVWVEPMSVW